MTCDTRSETDKLESTAGGDLIAQNIDWKVRKVLFTIVFGAYQDKFSFVRV